MKFTIGIESKWSSDLLKLVVDETLKLNPKHVVIINAGNFEAAIALAASGYPAKQINCTDTRRSAVAFGNLFAGNSTETARSLVEKMIGWIVEENQQNEFLKRCAEAMLEQEADGSGKAKKLAESLAETAAALKGIKFIETEPTAEVWEGGTDTVVIIESVDRKRGTEGWSWVDYESELSQIESTIFIHDLSKKPDTQLRCIGMRRSKSALGAPSERILTNREIKRCYVNRPVHKLVRPPWEPMTNQVITAKSKLGLHFCDGEHAMYYRNLWIHQLGVTDARSCFLMSCDGLVMAAIGIELDKVQRRQDKWVYETYGTPAQNMRYKRLGKLMMMLLTSYETGEWIKNTFLRATDEIVGIRTTSLCKNPEHKIARGVLKTTHREQQPNGLWKLKFEAVWHDQSLQQTLAKWLRDEASATERKI